MNKFIDWVKGPKSDVFFLLILVILLNIAFSGAHARFDLTHQKTYTISEASKRTLRTLTQPVSIKIFFSKDLPSTYSTVYQYIKDIMTEYSGVGSKFFSYTLFDMDDPESEKIATGLGARQVQIQSVENNEVKLKQVWMSLAIVYGDSIDTLDAITTESGFEYKLTTHIGKLISTSDALASLDEQDNLSLVYYCSKELSQFGIAGLDSIEEVLKEDVAEANKKALDHLKYKRGDFSTSDMEDIADKYGLQLFNWENNDGTKGKGIFGLVLVHGEDFRTIALTVERGLFGYGIMGSDTLTDSISENMQSMMSSVREIGYITGHDEQPLESTSQDMAGGDTKFVAILKDMYSLKKIDLSKDAIPANLSTLIINGPKTKYSDWELYKLDQFVMHGGNLIIFADPFKMETAGYYQPTTFTPIDNGLNTLLTPYGITLDQSYVFDEKCYTSRQRSQAGIQSLELYWAPLLTNRELFQNHPITKNLGYVIFLQPGGIKLKNATTAALGVSTSKDPDIKITTLATTSDAAWTQTQNIQLQPNMGVPYDKSSEKKETLAVLLEGRFNSAFTQIPEKPKASDADTTDTSAESQQPPAQQATSPSPQENTSPSSNLATDTQVKKAVAPSKIFVAATSFITSDQLIDDAGNEPIAIFVRNVVDYFNGNGDLCTMRTKGVSFGTLRVTDGPIISFIEMFCTIGVAILVFAIALLAWKNREARRRKILEHFNPNDTRQLDPKAHPASPAPKEKIADSDSAKITTETAQPKEGENENA